MKIAIFYHISQMGLGAFIYQQQLHRLYASGLIEAADYIHFGVNGDQELFNVPLKATVKQNENWKEETETLLELKNFSEKNLDYRILYFHTKGVSKGTLIANAWRLMMEYFVIDKWKECVKMLDDYDCVGSNLNPVRETIWSDGTSTKPIEGTYNFTGNFWWANSKHIQTLDHKFLYSDYRIDRELWIGSNSNSNPGTIYQSGIYDSYTHYYKEEDYMK
tara:strand:- start:2219 stop:2875 length:657 start_codon:yes stop_codon:yes gene_type:complete